MFFSLGQNLHMKCHHTLNYLLSALNKCPKIECTGFPSAAAMNILLMSLGDFFAFLTQTHIECPLVRRKLANSADGSLSTNVDGGASRTTIHHLPDEDPGTQTKRTETYLLDLDHSPWMK